MAWLAKPSRKAYGIAKEWRRKERSLTALMVRYALCELLPRTPLEKPFALVSQTRRFADRLV